MTAEEVRTATPDNRMVGFPYTKAMNSNWDLDQAAAVVLCSAEAADRAGVARDRWVFPWAGTDAHDTPHVTNRWSLAASPAIRIAGRAALALAGVGVDDVGHIDLYSCFPSAVQVAAGALGLDEGRQLTVTGGLTFAGGPLNNYVTHSVATMVGVLRCDPGSLGLITANGGYLTKHAIGVYSTEPPPHGFRWQDLQADVDALPTRPAEPSTDAPVTVEAYTVLHDRGGPVRAVAACLHRSGGRSWGTVTDPGVMAVMMAEEHVGRQAHLDGAGRLDF
jgi:acetyl-CoA C-acetyltransferase